MKSSLVYWAGPSIAKFAGPVSPGLALANAIGKFPSFLSAPPKVEGPGHYPCERSVR